MRRALSQALLLCILLVVPACEDPGIGEVNPILGIGRQHIEFGNIAVGETLYEDLVVQNSGSGRLVFTTSITEELAGSFSVAINPSGLGPFSQAVLQLAFHPVDVGPTSGTLLLESNAKNNAEVEITLSGSGWRRGAIQVEPELIDFGVVAAGKAALDWVTITNVGNGELTITGIALSADTNPDFRIQSSTKTPAVLDEGQSAPLAIAYRPDSQSNPPDAGTLVIEAADPFQPTSSVELRALLNRAPVAQAGEDQRVKPFDQVLLDGSASQDPDGDEPLTYQWNMVRIPEGSTAQLSSLDTHTTSLVPDLVGVYEVELFVTDSTGLQSLLPDRVTITALPAQQVLLELVWESPIADLDLHLIAPGGSFGGLLDCHWGNRQPDWGQPGNQDDPQLIKDDLAGFGPETIGYTQPIEGIYNIEVDYFAAHTPSGIEPTKATLRIFIDGFLEAEITQLLEQQGQKWSAAQIRWPEGIVDELF